MIAHRLRREALSPDAVAGRVLCEDVRGPDGRPAFRRGAVLAPADAEALSALEWGELHLIEMAPDEAHEDEGGRRLAAALAGPGTEARPQHAGHWPVVATRRGLVAVAVDALRRVNSLDGLCAYTLLDGQVVDAGDTVGRAKLNPFVVPRRLVDEAERIAAEAGGLARVRAFQPRRVGAVVQERLDGRARDALAGVLGEKLGWFGSSLLEPRFVATDAGAVAEALNDVMTAGAEVVLMAGTRALDPLDPAFEALGRAGARLERYGVPAHPGSLFWLAYRRDVPILGVPSCGLFSQATTFDLALPRVLAGDVLTSADLAELGHGGLLTRELGFRFPPYRASRRRGELEP